MQLQNVLYFLVWAGLFFVMMRFGRGANVMGHVIAIAERVRTKIAVPAAVAVGYPRRRTSIPFVE